MLKPIVLAVVVTSIFALWWWIHFTVSAVPPPEQGGWPLLLSRVFGLTFWIIATGLFAATFAIAKPRVK